MVFNPQQRRGLDGRWVDETNPSIVTTPTATAEPASYVGADLRNHVFAGQDLRGVDFTFANLENADFTDCDLRGVNFMGANLEHAMLTDADVTGANFEMANLDHVNMDGIRGYGDATVDADVFEPIEPVKPADTQPQPAAAYTNNDLLDFDHEPDLPPSPKDTANLGELASLMLRRYGIRMDGAFRQPFNKVRTVCQGVADVFNEFPDCDHGVTNLNFNKDMPYWVGGETTVNTLTEARSTITINSSLDHQYADIARHEAAHAVMITLTLSQCKHEYQQMLLSGTVDGRKLTSQELQDRRNLAAHGYWSKVTPTRADMDILSETVEQKAFDKYRQRCAELGRPELSKEDARRSITNYAATSQHEAIAEAAAHHFQHPEDKDSYAAFVYESMKEYYKQTAHHVERTQP